MNANPLVLCLTNTVAANFTANCLLAVGAKPAMIEEPCEAEELAASSDAMLVNLGTVTTRQAEAMRRAIGVVKTRGVPWVLDPVGVQFLSFRRELAREFVALGPSLIRCNGPEAGALGETGCVTLVTGEVDVIRRSDDPEKRTIRGGTPLLQFVTATGCAQGAICAAFLGKGMSPDEAALAASRLMKRAGERAAERASEPGSFAACLIDALWELSHD